jgi:hypothetical protein
MFETANGKDYLATANVMHLLACCPLLITSNHYRIPWVFITVLPAIWPANNKSARNCSTPTVLSPCTSNIKDTSKANCIRYRKDSGGNKNQPVRLVVVVSPKNGKDHVHYSSKRKIPMFAVETWVNPKDPFAEHCPDSIKMGILKHNK